MNKPIINIRPYTEADASDLAAIYYHTIHTVNAADYTPEQLDVWAPPTSLQADGWLSKWRCNPPLVAECNQQVVGFAEFEANGHIDCFYCHHQWQGQGVGYHLMQAITQRANQVQLSRVYAEVSITAKPFFLKNGFQVVKQQTIERQGIQLTNYLMEKLL